MLKIWRNKKMLAKKTTKRINFLEDVLLAMMHEEIYGTIDYRKKSESEIKQFIYPKMIDNLSKYYMKENKLNEEKARTKARKSLLWEGNIKTTVNNFVLFGAQHRPDMVISDGNLNVGIEIKKGDDGSSIRAGIGQSIVYSQVFDFTIFLFIDTTKTKDILNSITGEKEENIICDLWNDYNILFKII
jgi:hypothetical protein